jgi:hypothetical protein
MAFKIFKNKKSEPNVGTLSMTNPSVGQGTKPIIYYSIDKKEYVTVYVPQYMNIYTNPTNKNTQPEKVTNIKKLYDDNDKLHEIYDYYLNNNKEQQLKYDVKVLEKSDVVKENLGKNEIVRINDNIRINDNSKNLDYITKHFQYDTNDDIYYYSTKDNNDTLSIYSDAYSIYSDT